MIAASPKSLKLAIDESKLTWKMSFLKHSVPSPKLYGYSKDGKWVVVNTPEHKHKQVIVKELYGCCGKNINVMTWEDALQHASREDNVIVEEYKVIKPATHYRVTTLCVRSKTVALQTLRIRDEHSEITSNHGTVKTTNRELKIQSSLLRLHELEFPYTFSISWDVIVDDTGNEYALEGNVPGALCWKMNCKEIHDVYMYWVRQSLK
jgi:hypothetical protein